MPAVLTIASKLTCAHQGLVQIPPVEHALTVDGQSVLLQSDLLNAMIVGCTNVSPSTVPCTSIMSVVSGAATKLTVDGQPALLETAQGLTNGLPAPAPWQVQSAGQTKLTAE